MATTEGKRTRHDRELLERLVKEQTEELERTNERLFLANQVKEEFLAHISKELRTPLNHILDLAIQMLEGSMGGLTAEQKAGLDSIIESGSGLRAIVDRILELCSADIGMSRFLPERFPVAEVLTRTLERMAELSGKYGIAIVPSFPAELGAIIADEQKFAFVVEELLTNALKFSAHGARITVTARQVKGGGGEREFLEISVADQGPGIRKEDLERIFKGFEIVGAAPFENGRLGLGLALVRRFVELHGGSIWADSSPGEGSTFTFILPKEGPLPGEGGTPRIMVASSDSNFLQMLSHCLREEGYEIATAATGLEALDRGVSQPPDLFILDIPLPEMNGYDVCLRLKSHASAKYVPVLLVIPSTARVEQVKSAQVGADGFFIKPLNIRELLSKIKLLISQKLNHEFLKRSFDIAVTQAHTDPLTGLFNLRQLWKVLDREIERSRRYSRFCSLAMIDIDFFKQFNDRFGHLQGDEVLKGAAEIFREHVRNSDMVARYGGEEFVVVMPETGKELALLVGEKLRKAFAEHLFPLQQASSAERLSISIGIATFPMDGNDSRELVDRADRALYRAKEGGRNRVVAWEEKE
ncbi:MAG: diguanylate cyclase [Geobacteraceae bacterium]|nr:diguanylate cyclase [Geobacteraceae bacterium]